MLNEFQLQKELVNKSKLCFFGQKVVLPKSGFKHRTSSTPGVLPFATETTELIDWNQDI